eukprot:CFRG6846T1
MLLKHEDRSHIQGDKPFDGGEMMPRVTAPASFLNYSQFVFFYVLLVLGALSSNAQPAAGPPTANIDIAQYSVAEGDYDPTYDYFPEKVDSDFAEFWTVEYFNSYKVVTDLRSNYTYVMYQRGTPVPVEADLNLPPSEHFAIMPVPQVTITVDETVPLRFLEVLGLLSYVRYVPAGTYEYTTSPCLQKMSESQNFTLSADEETMIAQIESTDIHIASTWLSPDLTDFRYYVSSVTSDPGALHRAEWIEFISLPFNKEGSANETFKEIEYNFMEYADTMQNETGPLPVVAWIRAGHDYYTGEKKYEIVDTAYKAEYLQAANVEMMAPGKFNESTVNDFHEALKEAEYVIDESFYIAGLIKNMSYFMEAFSIPENQTEEFKFLNKTAPEVFDVGGLRNDYAGLDWFEGAILHADTVLLDIISATRPSAELIQNHTRTWIWRISDEEPVIVTAANCTV